MGCTTLDKYGIVGINIGYAVFSWVFGSSTAPIQVENHFNMLLPVTVDLFCLVDTDFLNLFFEQPNGRNIFGTNLSLHFMPWKTGNLDISGVFCLIGSLRGIRTAVSNFGNSFAESLIELKRYKNIPQGISLKEKYAHSHKLANLS